MIRKVAHQLFFHRYLQGTEAYESAKKLAYSDLATFEKEHLRLINNILEHAYNNVPYYRSALATDSKKAPFISSLDELAQFPILTKTKIRGAQSALFSKDHRSRKSFINTSGGSTGEPLAILQDRNFLQKSSGLFALIKEIRTGDPFCRTVTLWGASRDIGSNQKSFKGRLIDFFNNTEIINAAKLTPEVIHHFVHTINKRRPPLIIAYVRSIYEVAKFVQQHNIKVAQQQAIHTGAGQLYPFMRELIEEVFKCKVFNHYGARETGALATECSEHNGLHILGSSVHLEIVNEKGDTCSPGEEGDILVTSLTNYSMPLIRYKIGDRAVAMEQTACSCGIVFPKIAKISGRTVNNFRLHSGGYVSGEYLTLTFNHIPGITNFQIRQKALNEITIYLVITDQYNTDTENKTSIKLKELFGPDLKIQFRYVNDIPLTKTGKHLFTISEI